MPATTDWAMVAAISQPGCKAIRTPHLWRSRMRLAAKFSIPISQKSRCAFSNEDRFEESNDAAAAQAIEIASRHLKFVAVDFLVVLAELAARPADLTRSRRKMRDHVMHTHRVSVLAHIDGQT